MDLRTAGKRAEGLIYRLRNGFTLVELLTVLGIILILAGLMVGAFTYMGRLALEGRTRIEVKEISAALEMYKQDNGEYPPLNPLAMNGDILSPEGFIIHQKHPDVALASKAWRPSQFVGEGTPRVESNFPTAWFNSQFVFRALSGGSFGPTNYDGDGKVYYRFKPKQCMFVEKCTGGVAPIGGGGLGRTWFLIDPMGNPYGYNPKSPLMNPRSFDFFSAGVDGSIKIGTIQGQNYPNFTSISNDDIGNWGR